MKKLLALVGILVLVGAIAVPVLAHGPGWGRGHQMGGSGRGAGPGYCGEYGPGYGNLGEEQRTQLDTLNKKFHDETAQVRNDLWNKRGELNALLNSPNPDTEKAKALQKEISDLRANLAEKRLDFELEERKVAPEGSYGRGYGKGYGMGYGHHMGGYGPGKGYGHHMGGYGPGMGYGHHMGGYGPGMGYGPHMGGGYGQGSCWN
jgi:zinc resistance-associated protein